MKNKLFSHKFLWRKSKILGCLKLTLFLMLGFTLNLSAADIKNENSLNLAKSYELSEGSQQLTVKGAVTDNQGSPLPGVTVLIKGTTQGTVTDVDGNYSLPGVTGQATLVFSFVGMVSQEVPVNNQSSVNVVMVEDAIGLDEVLVVGYGTQTKRAVSGSITSVTEKSFNKGATVNATDLLKGKVSGLVITTASGDPTEQASMRLRGTSSLSGSSEPFIVIDGVPGLSMSSVAPQDIESISVLKDASSSAIYGSRAASGVILITTKKGIPNQSSVQYNGYMAFDVISNKLDLLTADEWRTYVTDNNINATGLDHGVNTDWLDEIFRTGFTNTHDLSFTGGGNKNSYRASVSYQNREGILEDNFFKRLNTRISFNQKALKDKLDISLTGTLNMNDNTPGNTGNISLATTMLPVWPVREADGTWFDSVDFGMGNPVRNMTYNSNDQYANLLLLNLRANYQIVRNLSINVSVLKERDTNTISTFNSGQTQQGRGDQGNASRKNDTNSQELIETTINYQGSINDHQLTILGGYSWEENRFNSFTAQNRQFLTDIFTYNNLSAGEGIRAGDVISSANMSRLISFFGRVNYSFKERYILSGVVRQDGSSKFGINNKWGTFPSVSAAWRISDEPFMEGVSPILDELKLRVGYGVAGNQSGLDPYRSLELVGSSTQYYNGTAWITSYQVSQNANPNLKWEATANANIGLDFSFLEGRLNGTVEYYDRRTTNLLYTYTVPVPPYMYSSLIANAGTMQNNGVEIMLSGDIIRNNNLRWTATLNGAHNKNTILKLSNSEFSTTAIKLGSAFVRGGANTTTHILEEGKSVGQFFGWKVNGLDENGLYIYEDIDGLPGITEGDKTYIGDAQPKFTGGLDNQITYKNLDFSFFLRGVFGNDLLNFSRLTGSTLQWLPGMQVNTEALTIGLKTSPVFNSFYIEKGTFVRLENVSLAYSFLNKIGFNKIRLYFTGQNLLLFTKYQGTDPEVTMGGLTPGVEGRNYYPKARTYTFGIDVTF